MTDVLIDNQISEMPTLRTAVDASHGRSLGSICRFGTMTTARSRSSTIRQRWNRNRGTRSSTRYLRRDSCSR